MSSSMSLKEIVVLTALEVLSLLFSIKGSLRSDDFVSFLVVMSRLFLGFGTDSELIRLLSYKFM